MRIEMLIGLGLGFLILVGFVVWHFVIKKKPVIRQQQTQAASTGLKSLKTVAVSQSQTAPAAPVAQAVPVAVPKYRAMVWTDFGIVFKKIPERIGSVFYCDPSMPEKGEHLWVVEKVENGLTKYEPYDPREIPIVSEETPEWAFDSIHCYDLVYAWYKNKADMWDKVNTVLIGLSIAGMVLVCLVALDKISK